ncbi:MAG: hypothetical protein R6U50_11820 [Desulfobacterales bacterium]
MTRKKSKPVSYDAMVKFFMQYHNIPTKKDIEKLQDQLDRIEQMIKGLFGTGALQKGLDGRSSRGRKTGSSAADMVLKAVQSAENGIGIPGIQKKTGFDEKKLRNIIYRLNKTGKIRRKSRGIYTA